MKIRYFKDAFSNVGAIQSKSVKTICDGLAIKNDDFAVINNKKVVDCDLAVMFGNYNKNLHNQTLIRQMVIENQIKKGKDYMKIERGYVKRDEGYQSIGVNGHGNLAKHFNENSPSDRWDKLGVRVEEWDVTGDAVLIIGQVPSDSVLNGVNFREWVIKVIRDVKLATDRPIIFRKHPLHNGRLDIPGVIHSTTTLENDLKRAKVCITFNSTTGVESLIAGVPTISYGESSMVYDVTDHDVLNIESPKTFDRTQWLYDLAYTQWHHNEIKNGDFWEHYKQHLCQ